MVNELVRRFIDTSEQEEISFLHSYVQSTWVCMCVLYLFKDECVCMCVCVSLQFCKHECVCVHGCKIVGECVCAILHAF